MIVMLADNNTQMDGKMYDNITNMTKDEEKQEQMDENISVQEEAIYQEEQCKNKDDEFEQLKKVIPNVRNKSLSEVSIFSMYYCFANPYP